MRVKIDAGQSGGPSAERRNELRAELDKLRTEQGNSKNSRQQLVNQLKSLNETISRKAGVLLLSDVLYTDLR